MHATLAPGCTPVELHAFDQRFNVKLPDDVRESFRIHNGQTESTCPGPLVGQPFDTLPRVSDNFQNWRDFLKEELERASGSILHEFDDQSFPVDAIYCQHITMGWVPLGYWDGNCYGIDLNPDLNGIYGQVICFGRDEAHKYVLAESWAHFLEDIADELHAGNVCATRDERGEYDRFGRVGHSEHALYQFYMDWSKAKLPLEFQNVAPGVRAPVMPGPVIHDDAAGIARDLVERFILAMQEYELRWLKVRPIHEFGYRYVCETESGFSTDGLSLTSQPKPTEDLGIRKHMKEAIAERKSLLSPFVSNRDRGQDAFIQSWPLKYDAERDSIAEVRQPAPDHLIVYMHPVDGFIWRFHVKHINGRWLVDVKDATNDHLKFTRWPL